MVDGRDRRGRAGAVLLTVFGLGLLLRLVGLFERSSPAELWAYGAVAGVGLALLVWSLRRAGRR